MLEVDGVLTAGSFATSRRAVSMILGVFSFVILGGAVVIHEAV